MEIERVHPQLRAMARSVPRVNLGGWAVRNLARAGSRYLVPSARVPGVTVRNLASGAARVRLYTPEVTGGAALLWIHGGGMVIGAPRQDDRFCVETASQLGMVVASVDYRLAPEHPHPTPSEDCLAAWSWLQAGANALRIDPDRIAIGGASAGGGLAASVVNTLHDGGGVQPAAQWLVYPMLDDRTAARRELDAVSHFIWNNSANRAGWTALLRGGSVPGADDVPSAAAPARRAVLAGLPPTWIGVGDIDLFHAESLRYADRLAAAGVPVRFDVVAGAPHGFESLAPDAPVVRDFLSRARGWLMEATARR